MDVVPNDAELDDSRGVSTSDCRKQAPQECGGGSMDERQASERSPREQGVEANGHRSIMGWMGSRRSILNRRDGSQLFAP